jgi:acetolactate synthase-1/2/3 large subunit
MLSALVAASSLGWALGAAIGAKLAGDMFAEHAKDLIAVVVGDGSFVFGVPSAAYWMARRYDTVSLGLLLAARFATARV